MHFVELKICEKIGYVLHSLSIKSAIEKIKEDYFRV